jgi:hypothetical protein
MGGVMTRDDIIRMALEHFGAVLKPSDLEVKLAALAVAQEREACAKVCEEQIKSYMSKKYTTDPLGGFRERFAAGQCAAAIRVRGET